MDDLTLDEALEDLESAEDFLNCFGVVFDPAVVHVNRLHILQRYHNYLAQAGAMPESEAAQRDVYTTLLTRAYQDFVASDALTEKVFKVFHMHEPQTAFVPLSSITFATAPTPSDHYHPDQFSRPETRRARHILITLNPELDAALFTLPAGQVSDVLESPLGYHLLLCESIPEARVLSLDQARAPIRNLLEQRRKRVCQQAWMKQLQAS